MLGSGRRRGLRGRHCCVVIFSLFQLECVVVAVMILHCLLLLVVCLSYTLLPESFNLLTMWYTDSFFLYFAFM